MAASDLLSCRLQSPLADEAEAAAAAAAPAASGGDADETRTDDDAVSMLEFDDGGDDDEDHHDLISWPHKGDMLAVGAHLLLFPIKVQSRCRGVVVSCCVWEKEIDLVISRGSCSRTTRDVFTERSLSRPTSDGIAARCHSLVADRSIDRSIDRTRNLGTSEQQVLMHYTIADPKKHDGKYGRAIGMSFVWLVMLSYVMSTTVETLGALLGIDPLVSHRVICGMSNDMNDMRDMSDMIDDDGFLVASLVSPPRRIARDGRSLTVVGRGFAFSGPPAFPPSAKPRLIDSPSVKPQPERWCLSWAAPRTRTTAAAHTHHTRLLHRRADRGPDHNIIRPSVSPDRSYLISCYKLTLFQVMGISVSAAGTSFPNLFASMVVARQGLGNMAVSNALGGNVRLVFHGIFSDDGDRLRGGGDTDARGLTGRRSLFGLRPPSPSLALPSLIRASLFCSEIRRACSPALPTAMPPAFARFFPHTAVPRDITFFLLVSFDAPLRRRWHVLRSSTSSWGSACRGCSTRSRRRPTWTTRTATCTLAWPRAASSSPSSCSSPRSCSSSSCSSARASRRGDERRLAMQDGTCHAIGRVKCNGQWNGKQTSCSSSARASR